MLVRVLSTQVGHSTGLSWVQVEFEPLVTGAEVIDLETPLAFGPIVADFSVGRVRGTIVLSKRKTCDGLRSKACDRAQGDPSTKCEMRDNHCYKTQESDIGPSQSNNVGRKGEKMATHVGTLSELMPSRPPEVASGHWIMMV